MSEIKPKPQGAYQLAQQIAEDLGMYGPTLHPSRDAAKIYEAFLALRSRLESAERERDEARAVVADAEYALACEGGSFGYDSMQRLRRSVEAFDHTYGATTGPCQSPSTSKGKTNG